MCLTENGHKRTDYLEYFIPSKQVIFTINLTLNSLLLRTHIIKIIIIKMIINS